MKVICHMISSVDGRLLPDRWTSPEKPLDVTSVYESAAARFPADGWMIGRVSMGQYDASVTDGEPAGLRAAGSPLPEPFVGKRGGRMLALAFDPKGKLKYSKPYLATGEHFVAVLSPQVDDAYLASLRRVGVSYIFEGEGEDRLSKALRTAESLFGAKMLLLEGGGVINGAFLAAGLIDELSILIYPGIDGLCGVPSIFSAQGEPTSLPAQGQRLELLETQTEANGMVWLHYAVRR